MGISGLLGEFCRSFLCLFCLISEKIPASIKTSKSLPMQAVFSEVDEQHPSSLGSLIFSCLDGTTLKDATRRVDLPEMHAVDGHSVGRFCFCTATLSNLKTTLREG